MAKRRKYVKREEQIVVAVQLDLETDGFTYQKWGSEQRCKKGDWIVANGDDVYTVDDDSFVETYEEQSRALDKEVAPVWAEQAESAGTIATKEGKTAYEEGDYLVFNDEDGDDGYAVTESKFEDMYARLDEADEGA